MMKAMVSVTVKEILSVPMLVCLKVHMLAQQWAQPSVSEYHIHLSLSRYRFHNRFPQCSPDQVHTQDRGHQGQRTPRTEDT